MPQYFENQKHFGPFFGSILGCGGSCPLFQYSLVAWGLTTTDVSTTFPPSFFTVMPKGLTTGPKSMSDRTWPITTAEQRGLCCQLCRRARSSSHYLLLQRRTIRCFDRFLINVHSTRHSTVKRLLSQHSCT